MQNIQSDTAMRNSLGKAEEEKAEKLSSVQKKESSMPLPPKQQMPQTGFGGGFSSQMNPLAARFASLANAQKKSTTTDDNK